MVIFKSQYSCHCDGRTAVCSNQNSATLPGALPSFINALDFTQNSLARLNFDLCRNFAQLESLMLNENQIDSIDSDSFYSCQKLTKLTLKSNQIKKLAPAMFDDLRELEILDLRTV